MNRIQQLRKSIKWSQLKLADFMNVSRSTISMWESGTTEPSNQSLDKLATLFNVSVDYILGRSFDPTGYSKPEDDDIWELREQLRRQPGMRYLFSAAKGVTEADLRKAVKIIEALKGDTDAD